MCANRALHAGMHQASHGVEGRGWIALLVLGTIALLAFVKIGQDVLVHRATPFDDAVRSWMSLHRTPGAYSLFLWVTRIGSTRVMYAVALIASVYLWYRDDWRVAASVLIAPTLAIAVYETVKRIYGRARPPGFNHVTDGSFSFPSAHATAATAVCCSLAYVLWREGAFGRFAMTALGIIVPALIGVSRAYLDAHWATDVLGGWSAGLCIAMISAGAYDRARLRGHTRAAANSGPRTTR
jgi:undecaprenyl-diphosphatase